MASVKVAVRARPISEREIDMNCSSILRMDGKKTFITNTKLPQGGNDTLGRERVKQFTYDYSYWSADPGDQNHASQEQVFADLGQGVVESALDGYNACVFAYGQTGSGKTYTMMGTPDNLGLIPRICEDLFCKMTQADTTYRTEVSFLEIYNERVRDLLRDKKEKQQILRVREHPKDGPYVQDLSKHLVVDYSDVSELLVRGNTSRTTASTNMNDYSSRSHAIFTLLFTQARFNEDIPVEINSKIHLVDLAGSERAAASGATGDRLKEGGSINKSLVTLGNVISTLADISDKMAAIRKHLFIPYRDSVLTWLLKDSLGGNSKTVMIATVSPAECNYAESLSTLRYANRAKRIVNQPTVNEDPHVKLIRELREENRRLKALLGDDRGLVAMQEKLSRNEEKVKKLTEKWTDKWHETASILQEHKMLALRKEGTGVVLDSELPYLLALDPNILTTGMKLYHLKEEEIRVGTDHSPDPPDIVLSGKYIEPNHCLIVHQNGEVFLVPLEGALCSVNNVRIHEATKLTQGAVIRLGSSNIFRFNHPGEAAKMREEIFKNNGPNSQTDQLVQVWEDFRWSWSRSLTDSALGSELDLDQSTCSEEWGKLEARRRELERQEEEHCLAEARRLAALAEQEVSKATLQEKEEELKNLTSKAASMKLKAEKAHKDIKKLSESFEQQLVSDFELKKRLQEEKDRLREQKEKLEKNKQRAREERKKIRKEREVEKAKRELEKERQQEEWERMKLEKEQVDKEKEKNELKMKSEKEHLQEEREIEQAIYHESMTDMRLMVEREVKDMRRLVGVPDRETGEEDLHELQLSDLLDGPVIPAEYLQKSLEPPMSSPTQPFTEATADNINDKLEELGAQVLEIRGKVYSVLHRKYNSILSIDDVTPGLCEEVVCQFNGLRPLFSQLEKVAKSCNSDKSIEEKLKHYDAILATVDTFLQIHAVIQDIDNAIKVKEFLIAIERMDAVHNLLASLELDESAEQDLHRLLNTEVSILREKLLFELSETWNKLLKWTLPLDLKRVTNKPSKVTLEVGGVEQNKEVFTKTVQAMFDTNLLESRLKTLFDRIMTYFVQAVIRDRNTLLQIIDETEKYICVIFQPMKGHQGAVPVPPNEAFSKLEQVFLFLHKPFDKVVVNEAEGAGAKSKPVTLVEKMGSMISKPLFECVYNECLCHFIPSSSKQFESFTEIIKLTETFQSTLVGLNFVEQQESTMMDYLSDVNSMFVNIKSQELLKKAEEFMTKELMFSIQISKEHPLGFRSKRRESEEQEKFVNNCRELAGTSQYRFPTCQVSVPVRSLMCLAYDTCRDAINGSTANAIHLCQSVCRMFELYCDIVPSYHKEKLMNLPLLAALHHNNCMFVAHHLITLDQMFQSRLPSPRDSRLGDLVPNVRRLGNDSFTDHVAMKKHQLCEHLSDADGFECVADDFGEGASKALRLMLHHLRHIGSVWRDVLPKNVYFKAMGSLLNAAVTEITDSVLAIEEFSAEDCECLQKVLSIVIDNAGRVFEAADSTQNPQVILHEHVDTWMKFTELNLVLQSDLQQVSDRWADGKGPLALHFSAEEIRGIVIAIFENTSKRDALLKQLR